MKYNTDAQLQQQKQCSSEERYPALRSIISMYKVLAWLTIGGAVLVSLVAAVLFNIKQSVPFIMILMFVGIVGFVNFIAFSESISVILDIEHNTRNI